MDGWMDGRAWEGEGEGVRLLLMRFPIVGCNGCVNSWNFPVTIPPPCIRSVCHGRAPRRLWSDKICLQIGLQKVWRLVVCRGIAFIVLLTTFAIIMWVSNLSP